MSEYQYYEFRTVDRSLTAEEMAELRRLSSRAEISATSFTNTYSFGNFRGNPDRLMEQYFDAFVYVANWGTRHLMIRLPVRGVDLPTVESYAGGGLAFWIKGDYVILSFRNDEEGGGEWVDGGEWMPGLISLRDELLSGDLRALYLGWLSGVYGDVDDGEREPPVPVGLRTLTAAQDDLAAFLRIAPDLLAAAAERSEDRADPASSQAELAAWLRSQRTEDKDAWLLELLGHSAPAGRSEILLQFRQTLRVSRGEPGAETSPGRTGQELRDAAEARMREAERRRAEETAARKAKEAKQAAKLRNLELDQLAHRIDAAWAEVDQKVATKQPHQYARAVQELADLRDLATRDGHVEPFAARLRDLVHRHERKYAFVQRLRKAGLTS